jgi:hypothetical protein
MPYVQQQSPGEWSKAFLPQEHLRHGQGMKRLQ